MCVYIPALFPNTIKLSNDNFQSLNCQISIPDVSDPVMPSQPVFSFLLLQDMKYFSFITRTVTDPSKSNAVIMGRRTFESLPERFRPLPDRLNIVISSTLPAQSSLDLTGPVVVSSFTEALELLTSADWAGRIERAFVIGRLNLNILFKGRLSGGKRVYEEALRSSNLKSIFLTRVQGSNLDSECDVSLPTPFIDENVFVPVSVSKTRSAGDLTFDFVRYERESLLKDVSFAASTAASTSNRLNTTGLECEHILMELKSEIERTSEFIDSLDTPSRIPVEQVRSCPYVISRGHEEFQYLDLIADIISSGFRQEDRTGSRLGTREFS